ncbi:Crp/Fnr family transcriptional regulator [Streptomyces sp. NPDC057702]|uniref:Crp/Fnr family transcriptional regulator n=1 Tax=unclassified Streptomyces TaxID=2593676 RepID=UPI0036781280
MRRTPNPWPSATFLGRVEPQTLEELLAAGTAAEYAADRTLLHQGEDSRHVLLITRGVVKVVAGTAEGHEMLVAVRVAGDLVGEMAALESRPRSGTVLACGEVTVRVIQWHILEKLLHRHPDAADSLMHMLCARLRWANRRRLDFRAYDSSIRLARVLAELTQMYGRPVRGAPDERQELAVTLTQTELASLAGLALTTAEKALADLARLGLVERSYRRITINDFPRLLVFSKIAAENPY